MFGEEGNKKKKDNVFSGETENLQLKQEEWSKLYHTGDDKKTQNTRIPLKWTYEQVVEEDSGPFLEAIGQIKVIPAYRYVVNYLLSQTELEAGESNQKKFADFIAEGKFLDAAADMKEKQIRRLSHGGGEAEKLLDQKGLWDLWRIFTSRLDCLFHENGYRGSMDWSGFFAGVVEAFNYESLKQMALGVHMSLEDFNIFLKKVLKRSGINFYDRDEIFVYLTLQYADRYGCGAYYQAYEKLCQLYPKKDMKKKKPEKQPEWEETVSTRFLGRKLEKLLGGMSSTVFEQPDEKLEKFLEDVQQQNMRLKDNKKENKNMMRTAQRRFLELWNRLRDEWGKSETMTEIIRLEREARKKGAEDKDVYYKDLTIIYNPENACILPAGTRFEAKTEKASAEGNDTAVFCLPKEHVLPARKTELLEVKVKALMPEEEFNTQKESVPALNDLREFVKNEWLDYLENKNPETKFSKLKVCSQELEKKIEDIRIKEKVRFYASGKKGNQGTFFVLCKIGTQIPKGTRFCFEIDGVQFGYESLEEIKTEGTAENPRISAKIKTVWKNIEEFQRAVISKKCLFLPKGTAFSFGRELKNVHKVYVANGTTLEPANGEEKNYKVSSSLMFRQIYDTLDEKNADSSDYYQGFPEYGKEYFLNTRLFKETRLIRSQLSNPPKDEEKLRNLILTLKFLEYVWDEKAVDYDAYSIDIVLKNFLIDHGTDAELTICGFHAFSTNFPYDAFIALLLNSYDPLGLFQAVWSDRCLLRKEKENEIYGTISN